MTARATFTVAQIARAIRAAKGEGMVAVMTPQGIAFVESDKVTLPSTEPVEPSAYDGWKAKREARGAGRA
jgi:hypothetical protein